MADVIKVLGQVDSSAASEDVLYTVPAQTMTTTSSLVVCNRTTASINFRINVAVAGAVTEDKQYLFYDAPLAANSTMTAILGMTLLETDVVRTYASVVDVSFNLFGVETS